MSRQLPDIPETILHQALLKDNFFKVKSGRIDQFFSSDSSTSERAAFAKSIFNEDYSQLFVEGSMTDYYGYKSSDDGLLIWVGNYLSRAAERFLSWAEVAHQYLYMQQKRLLIVQPAQTEQYEQLSFFDI